MTKARLFQCRVVNYSDSFLKMMLKYLILLNIQSVFTRGLYGKQKDWKWIEPIADQTNNLKDVRHSWSWNDTPVSSNLGLTELFRSSPYPSFSSEPYKAKSRQIGSKSSYNISILKSTTEEPRKKRKRPRKQYVPFNR